MKETAMVIGNGGLGDMITCIGMVNYIATKYKHVIVACMKHVKEQASVFYTGKNIILYPINGYDKTIMRIFDVMMRQHNVYDIYAYGHYGAHYVDYKGYTKQIYIGTELVKKPIIHDYPISYYEDVNMPIDYMTKYFKVDYPKEIISLYDELLPNYPNYIVIHHMSSNTGFDIVKFNSIDIEKNLVIDVNNNLYPNDHKYYDIAQKFINLSSAIYYAKLVENAGALYLMDSCIHAICLVADVSKANPKICYQREYRTKYGLDKFKYLLLAGNKLYDIKLPLDPRIKSVGSK